MKTKLLLIAIAIMGSSLVFAQAPEESSNSECQKKVLKKIRNKDKNLKTHCRDMVILPEMVGQTIKIF